MHGLPDWHPQEQPGPQLQELSFGSGVILGRSRGAGAARRGSARVREVNSSGMRTS
ncbi:hypothetical protein GCM10009802_44280 [Streptomyces synnematoformans]|uniref:Uncharacterized protein n=1 Tax=Streptomyces synnematoformans TaxID=415721 RepID=A0ABN2Z1V5_9ACTN